MSPLHRHRNVIAAMIYLLAITIPGARAQQTPTAKDLAAVIDMLRSPDPVVRTGVACARDVFNANATAAIPALVDLLDDDEPVAPEVCREDGRPWWGDERRPITPGQEAARALVRIGSASVDALLKTLAATGPVGRRNAAWALGALHDGRAIPQLTTLLKDSDVRVRREAAWAIGAVAQ